MSSDRHSEHYMVQRAQEREEFRHLAPSHMARLLLTKMRSERRDERERVKRLQGPRPIQNVGGVVTIGPALLRGLEGNLERLERQIELVEEALELMKDGPRARWWTLVDDPPTPREMAEILDGE